MNKESKVRFSWLRDEKNNPVACIASCEHSSNFLKFAVAAHNPIDKFNRNIAREVAEGRLAGHNSFVVKKEGNPKLNILDTLASHSQRHQLWPTRVVQAAKYQRVHYKPFVK